MKKLVAIAGLMTMFAAPGAFAHSDYWRCAAGSGNNYAARYNCGSRSYYDRTGRFGEWGYGGGYRHHRGFGW